MDRRKALATAGAVTVTGLAAALALGANLGLFGLATARTGPGDFAPVGAASSTRTEVVEVPVPGEAVPSAADVSGEARGSGDEGGPGDVSHEATHEIGDDD
jgi:hypothetical protein